MNKLMASVTGLALLVSMGPLDVGGSEPLRAVSMVQDATLLDDRQMGEVEGSALIFGSVNTPLYYDSISAFLDEVLLTLLGVGGRSPIATYTTVRAVFSPLPGGSISIGIQPDTFILVKNLSCVGCTRP